MAVRFRHALRAALRPAVAYTVATLLVASMVALVPRLADAASPGLPAQLHPVSGVDFSDGGIACSSSTACVAVGNPVYGTTGSVVPIEDGVPGHPSYVAGVFMRDVACATSPPLSAGHAAASTCLAVGDTYTSPNVGALPSLIVPITNGVPGPPVTVPGSIDAVACPATNRCLAVGTSTGGSIIAIPITDGVPGRPSSDKGTQATNILAVACASSSSCVAAGNDQPSGVLFIVPLVNGIPGRPVPISGTRSVNTAGIACQSASTCVVAYTSMIGLSSEGSIAVVTGGIPSAPITIPGAYQFNGIACASTTSCLAVGDGDVPGGMVVRVDDDIPGRPLSVPSAGNAKPGFSGVLEGIACAPSGVCTATAHVPDTPYDGILDLGQQGSASVMPSPGIRPIIFLPGITGSYLVDQTGHEVWPDAPALLSCLLRNIGPLSDQKDCDLLALLPDEMNSDGTPIDPGVDVPNGIPPDAAGVKQGNPKNLSEVGGSEDQYFGGALNATAQGDIYVETIENLEASGYVKVDPGDDAGLRACAATHRCVIPMGLDWRRSSEFNADRVLNEIDRVISLTGTDRVDILAHSQGGLVAEAVVDNPGSVGKIYRVATMGTPYLGTPKLLAALLTTNVCQAQVVSVGPLGLCALDPSAVQDVVKDMPGVLELLPSRDYFAAVSPVSPIFSPTGNGSPWGSYDSMINAVAAKIIHLGGNPALLAAAEAWHDQDDGWHPADPTVQLVRAVGYDATGDEGDASCKGIPCNPVDPSKSSWTPGDSGTGTIVAVGVGGPLDGQIFHGTGDGTVAFQSASLYNPATGFDMRGGQHNLYFCALDHQGLAQSTVVWLAVEPFLEGTTNYTQDEIVQHCPGGGDGSLSGFDLDPLSVFSTILPGGLTAQPYFTSLAATGSSPPYAWSVRAGSLPPGLSLNPSRGSISGTPTRPGVYFPTLTVADSDGRSASATDLLAVFSHPVAILGSDTASGTGENPTVVAGGPDTSVLDTVVSATGVGTVTVIDYGSNPSGTPLLQSAGGFFDVAIQPGAQFDSLDITRCGVGAAQAVYWWDGSDWDLASDQKVVLGPRLVPLCRTVHVDATTSPNLSQLRGTYFGVARDKNTSTSTNDEMSRADQAPLIVGAVAGAAAVLIAMAIALTRRRRAGLAQ